MNEEEKIDRLVETLAELGFHSPDIYGFLENHKSTDSILYTQRTRIGDDLMNYQLTIKRREDSGLLYPESYQATLLKTHPIPHGKFGSIDTLELEKRMKATDWTNYAQQVMAGDRKVSKIFDDVFELSLRGNKQAKDIARRLKLRYWLGTPVEKHLQVASYAPDYEKSYHFKLNNDLSDIQAGEAYNLLCGRAVMKFYQKNEEPVFYSHWKQMDGNELKTLPDYEFMAQLKQLPLIEMQQDKTGISLIHSLLKGDECLVHLDKNNQVETAYLEMSPVNQSIRLFSETRTELNPGYYQLNEVQKYLFQKKHVPKLSPGQKPKGKRKGRSL